MGLFGQFKKKKKKEYDYGNLEELVYYDDKLEDLDDEEPEDGENHLFKWHEELLKKRENEKKEKEEKEAGHIGAKTLEQQKRAQMEEERYDHLLNSVQAQDLIKKVDKIKKNTTKTNNKSDKPDEFDKSEDTAVPTIQEKETVSKTELPDVNKKPKRLDYVNVDKFGYHDMEVYVRNQCDIMEEASAHIEEAKNEYESVTEYFDDIQLIKDAPQPIKDAIQLNAERVDNLTVDRRIFKSSESKLSNNIYRRMEALEDEIPRGINYIKKQESYYGAVQHDMRMLEGERMGLRMDANELTKRQLNIRKLALIAGCGLFVVFVIFLIAGVVMEDTQNTMLFITVVILAAVLSFGLFAMLKVTERQVLVTEIKLNKATALLNKTKIKYINAANTLDYEYNKYGVKSSYELSQKYQVYVEMKEEQKKLLDMTSNLNEAEKELERILTNLGLYDPHIWLGQVRALINSKEMVEVTHGLTVRRQKLRKQIEYNENRLLEAKENIKNITKSNPQYAQSALKVIEAYEKKNR